LAVKIRLARGGRKKLARFRVVVTDSRSPRDGRFVETLGYYNPQAEPAEYKLNAERIGYWLGSGAVLSTTVKNLMKKDNTMAKIEAIEKGLAADAVETKAVKERGVKAKARAKKKSAEAEATTDSE